MSVFKGFSTIGKTKKFSLVDFDLIKRDLLNAFLIREGELPGRPEIGSKIWSFIFEPMVEEVRRGIELEVTNIVAGDPRLRLKGMSIFTDEHTITVEIQVDVLPDISPETIKVSFNKEAGTASIA